MLTRAKGRPPALSRRYLTIELPLDVSNDELMQDDLGPSDSTSGCQWMEAPKANYIQRRRIRAFMQTTILRDEILELCLGAPPPDLSQQVIAMRGKLERFWNQLPRNIPHHYRSVTVFEM